MNISFVCDMNHVHGLMGEAEVTVLFIARIEIGFFFKLSSFALNINQNFGLMRSTHKTLFYTINIKGRKFLTTIINTSFV